MCIGGYRVRRNCQWIKFEMHFKFSSFNEQMFLWEGLWLAGESSMSPASRPAEKTNPHVTSFLPAFLALAFQRTRRGMEEGEREGMRGREGAMATSRWREPDEVTVVMGFKLKHC